MFGDCIPGQGQYAAEAVRTEAATSGPLARAQHLIVTLTD